MEHRQLMAAALRERPVDLLIRGTRLVNVHTAEVHEVDIGVVGDGIAVVGDGQDTAGPDTHVIDAEGRLAIPGLIDAHIHTYESHLPPASLAPPMLEHGVTTIVTDFYGEAVVGGKEAVKALLAEAGDLPWNVLYVVPLPAFFQDRPFAHSGTPTLEDVREMLRWPQCIGLNECFAPFVTSKDAALLGLMEEARAMGKALCGHASETTGQDLMGWVAYGGYLDDHECVATDEVVEKARLGVRIIMREGSAARDVRSCVRAITERGVSPRAFAFCSDLLSPVDLLREGDIDRCVRMVIEAGVDPIEAVRMATLNAAEAVGVQRWVGSVAPGKRADLCLLDGELEDVRIDAVVSGGALVVEGGRYRGPRAGRRAGPVGVGSVRVPELTPERLRLQTSASGGQVRARVIRVEDGSIITREQHVDLPVSRGDILPAPDQDVARVAAIERHGVTGAIGLGFVQGFGLRRGAIASTYNPHNQHLLVLGQGTDDMLAAAEAVRGMGGGFAVVSGGEALALVPLPRYGLLSEQPADALVREIDAALDAAAQLGCRLNAPFHTLAFLGLPVIIGTLKICSAGLVDVWKGEQVPVEVDASAP